MQDITKIPVEAERRSKLSPTSEVAWRSPVLVMFFDINPIAKMILSSSRKTRARLVCLTEKPVTGNDVVCERITSEKIYCYEKLPRIT